MTENMKNSQNYWAEIRNDFEADAFDPKLDGKIKRQIMIDAYKTGMDDEEGQTIAQVILTQSDDICIIYIDNVARWDEYAQEMIQEAVERLSEDPIPFVGLYPIPDDLLDKLKTAKLDEDIADLGFVNKGQLRQFKRFENMNERNWVWIKVEGKRMYIIATFDTGNSTCSLSFRDIYIKELVDEANLVAATRPYTIISKDGKLLGYAYEDEDLECEMEGCNGTQYSVKWTDGEETVVCGKGLRWIDEFTAQIEE